MDYIINDIVIDSVNKLMKPISSFCIFCVTAYFDQEIEGMWNFKWIVNILSTSKTSFETLFVEEFNCSQDVW